MPPIRYTLMKWVRRKRYLIIIFICLLIVYNNLRYLNYSILPQPSIPTISYVTEDDILWVDKPPKPPFPIDIVYTWSGPTSINNKYDQRSRDNGELRYSLRSIYQNMPWFNHIYILVSDINIKLIKNNLTFINYGNDTPNEIHLTAVSHSDVFRDKNNSINQQNSDAIESALHRLPNLSDYYIYLNDDFFIGQKLSYKYFFILDAYHNRLIPRLPYLTSYLYHTVEVPWYMVFAGYTDFSSFTDTFCSSDLMKYNLQPNDIPFNNKQSTIKHHMAHLPHPYYKKDIEIFDNKYPKLFDVIQSHKKRFFNCDHFQLSIQRHFVRLWLNNTFKVNFIYFKYYDYPYSFGIKYIHPSIAHKHTYYQYWLMAEFVYNIDNFKYHLSQITKKKPYTFCLNDDYPEENYQHLEEISNFMESYFSKKSPAEK